MVKGRYNRIIVEIKIGNITMKELNNGEVEETIERKLKIYNEKTDGATEKIKNNNKRIDKYLRFMRKTEKNKKIILEKSDMKDRDNEYIYYKHYIIEEFKRILRRKGKNNENKIIIINPI